MSLSIQPRFTTALRRTTAMTGVMVLVATSSALALPQGGQVVGGQANISGDGSQLNIHQTTHRAILNWQSFDIGHGEQVAFHQPSASSVALNRVTGGQNPSQILGSLTANGTVMLVNPNGVIFGQNSQVNVGNMVASSGDITNDRFLAGDYRFDIAGNPHASIVNDGSITVAEAGLASFVAPSVVNNGLIQARLGKVQLASGDTFTLDLHGDGLVSLEAGPTIAGQFVVNSGVISADGGKVLLTAAAAQSLVDSLINMDGIIQAASIGEQNGEIVIYAAGSHAVEGNLAANKGIREGTSTIEVSGALTVSGHEPDESAGKIVVTADEVKLLDGAVLDASGGQGVIHIGGDYQGQGDTPTARRVEVSDGAFISANGGQSGTGGRVIVWADDTTTFAGVIEARGGSLSGDGGFVETSGKQMLSVSGTVDVSAPLGAGGTWLLDPQDIVVANSGGTVTPAALEATLNGGGSVLLSTVGAGDISILDPITQSVGAGTMLMLDAARDILLQAPVTSTNGLMDFILLAGRDIAVGDGLALTMENLLVHVTANRDITFGAGLTATMLNSNGVFEAGRDIAFGDGAAIIREAAAGSGRGMQFYADHDILFNNATFTSSAGTVSDLREGFFFSANAGATDQDGGFVQQGALRLLSTAFGAADRASPHAANFGFVTGATGIVGPGWETSTLTWRDGSTGGARQNTEGRATELNAQLAAGPGIAAGQNAIWHPVFYGNYDLSLTLPADHQFFSPNVNLDGALTVNTVGTDHLLMEGLLGQGFAAQAFRMNGTDPLKIGVVDRTGADDHSSHWIGQSIHFSVLEPSQVHFMDKFGYNYLLLSGPLSVTGAAGVTVATAANWGLALLAPTEADQQLTFGLNLLNPAGFNADLNVTVQNPAGGGQVFFNADATVSGALTIQADDRGLVSNGSASYSANQVNLLSAGDLSLPDVTISVGGGAGVNLAAIGDIAIGSPAALTLGSVSGRNVRIGSASDLTIAGGGSVTATSGSGDSLILTAGRNFINHAGPFALATTGAARWLVYSANPATDVAGGLDSEFNRYFCSYGRFCPALPAMGNGFLYRTMTYHGNVGYNITNMSRIVNGQPQTAPLSSPSPESVNAVSSSPAGPQVAPPANLLPEILVDRELQLLYNLPSRI